MDTLLTIGNYVLLGLGGVTAALIVVAPLTATDWDNKALAGLRWVEGLLRKVIPAQKGIATSPVKAETPAGQPKGKGL
jgi:hypothetical protein